MFFLLFFFSYDCVYVMMIGMVVRHVIELRNIDVISWMDQFKNYLRWFHMLVIHRGGLTRLLFFDSLLMDYASIIVSFSITILMLLLLSYHYLHYYWIFILFLLFCVSFTNTIFFILNVTKTSTNNAIEWSFKFVCI